MDSLAKKKIKSFLIDFYLGRFLLKSYGYIFFLNDKIQSFIIIRKLLTKLRAKKIIEDLNRENYKKIVLVYDCKVSSQTIGDYFSVVMLAKYFLSLGYFIHLYIIDGEYRDGWNRFSNKKEIRRHLINHLKITNVILKKNFISQIINYKSFINLELFTNKDIYIVHKNRVKKRTQIYKDAFNLLNFLMSMSNATINTKTLLNKNDFKNEIQKKLPKNFITFHCRKATKKIGTYRNLSASDFVNVIKIVKSKFPKMKIIIISDRNGCNFFKKISKKNNLDCLFSKSFSNSFMGDGHIVLNSKLYLQLFGGGVNVFPWFSKIPCIVNHYDMSNEIFWNNKKICYWHGKKQFFHISTKSDIFYNKLEAANLKQLNV